MGIFLRFLLFILTKPNFRMNKNIENSLHLRINIHYFMYACIKAPFRGAETGLYSGFSFAVFPKGKALFHQEIA